MVIGELFLAAFLQVLFERLMSPDLLQFARREWLHPTLKKWERKLKTIESVLNDAEEKQLTDNDVKMWLDDLRDLAYDVEDILDEFSTEALRRKLIMPTHDHYHQGASSSTSKSVMATGQHNADLLHRTIDRKLTTVHRIWKIKIMEARKKPEVIHIDRGSSAGLYPMYADAINSGSKDHLLLTNVREFASMCFALRALFVFTNVSLPSFITLPEYNSFGSGLFFSSTAVVHVIETAYMLKVGSIYGLNADSLVVINFINNKDFCSPWRMRNTWWNSFNYIKFKVCRPEKLESTEV
ncbi:hypothetical protein Dsin_028114 [Dipteronia sinensis]|uniref:Disease resistance N-terminal domain-containing protein n=1 Tax=Dipteronia sinensis TaxID=43782 RepID=A0AAD9ZQ12_9ROSI|nr:hypothetical protein Dsin_028114 [Dipteronia sinensis]